MEVRTRPLPLSGGRAVARVKAVALQLHSPWNTPPLDLPDSAPVRKGRIRREKRAFNGFTVVATPRPRPLTGNEARLLLGEKLSWVSGAIAYHDKSFTPLHTYLKLCQHAAEITPTSERLANESLKALLMPFPFKGKMDSDDAKGCLEHVVDKVTTRAAKRKTEAAAAAAAAMTPPGPAKVRIGEARAAKRAAIASRPVKTVRTVDKFGRAHVFQECFKRF